MLLFSVPLFRFSIVDPSTAIGKWSLVATMGPKSKDGERLVFDATTLGQMVDNAARRGDKIAINNDHASAFPETRDAPALGFFGALAVVASGQVVKFWNGQPDPAGMADGLYARLDEITPRGSDPLVGLANYRTLSPMFTAEGKGENDEPIGYALLDVGATNVPFQAGAEIAFHNAPRAGGAASMPKIVTMDSGVDPGDGAHKTALCPACGQDVFTRTDLTQWPPKILVEHNTQAGEACVGSAKGIFTYFSNAKGNSMTPTMLSKLGLAATADKAAQHAAIKKFTADAPIKMAAMDGAACKAMGDDLEAMSELADEESKATMKALAAKFKKMGAPDAPAAEPDKPAAAMAATEPDTDDKDKDTKAMSVQMAAIQAANAGMATQLAALQADKAARDAATTAANESRFAQLATDAISGGYPAEAKDALIAMARTNEAAAEKIAEPFTSKVRALSRSVLRGNLPANQAQVGSDVKAGKGTIAFGQQLASAIKMHMKANPRASYIEAADAVSKEHPEFVTSYHNGGAQ